MTNPQRHTAMGPYRIKLEESHMFHAQNSCENLRSLFPTYVTGDIKHEPFRENNSEDLPGKFSLY